ncbi:hypothetical protein [Phreatobacter stygius]|uniref:Uncharacterized protein n=1 Tax=Phreatobacter stygius TaxID=1940610 RepID=A0A4D7BIL2_9HYPH|nr:hypothetical protein [Phreatobacter stygius]QCI68866.1 hypothetical protein E8M01_34330 [Phreatobacter stygius]
MTGRRGTGASGRRPPAALAKALLIGLLGVGGPPDRAGAIQAARATGVPDRAVPADLVGAWAFSVAIGNYCNPLGHCSPDSGGSMSFTIRADGQAEHALVETSRVEGCGQIRTLTRKRGTIKVNGPTLVFLTRSGTYTSSNGCRPDLTGTWNLEARDLAPRALTWQLVADPGAPGQQALRLVDPENQMSGTYSRR